MSESTSTNHKSLSPPSLRHATLSELAQGLNNDLFTAVALTKAYISRIHEVNSEFHAITELNPHAISDASLLDTEYHLTGPRDPLHRIPILLKDNIPTLDDTDTTCGSLALVGARPPKEADVVTALRKAGAVILGKANMAEWAGFRSTSGCSGWSARGGQTRGVYFKGMKASGSSSGCAVAVALGLCGGAVGTEVSNIHTSILFCLMIIREGVLTCIDWWQTCYSVVSPAEKSGIVGYKPTQNLISNEGLIHASKALDTVGLLTRYVDDARLMLREIITYSTHHTTDSKQKLLQHIQQTSSAPDLKGLRIGIPSSLPFFSTLRPAKRTAFTTALSALENAGAILIPDVYVAGYETYTALSSAQKNIMLDTDLKTGIEAYLSSLTTNPNKIHTLADLIEFTQNCAGEEYPARNTEVLERALLTCPDDPAYLDMLALDSTFSHGENSIASALNTSECDLLIVPNLDPVLQTLAAKAGSPVLSISIGIYPDTTEVVVDKGNGMVDIAPGIPYVTYIHYRCVG
jgi:amidase